MLFGVALELREDAPSDRLVANPAIVHMILERMVAFTGDTYIIPDGAGLAVLPKQ